MKDLSMQFLNLTNFFPLSHLKVKLLMKTGERRIMIKVVNSLFNFVFRNRILMKKGIFNFVTNQALCQGSQVVDWTNGDDR